MLRYIVKRVIAGFLSLFMLITLTFFLMHVIPGGPFSPGEYRKTPPEVLKQIQDSYGLNDPIHVQYGRYLNNLAHGNLGVSFKKLNYSVNELIGNGAPVSAKVGFWAILLALLVGIPLGTTAAVRRGHLAGRRNILAAQPHEVRRPGQNADALPPLLRGLPLSRRSGLPDVRCARRARR